MKGWALGGAKGAPQSQVEATQWRSCDSGNDDREDLFGESCRRLGAKLNHFLALLLLLLGSAARVAMAGPVLQVGNLQDVSVGSTFVVPVRVLDARSLTSYQFDLSFDENVIAVVGFSDAGTDFERAAVDSGGVLTGVTGFGFPGLLSGVADSMSGAQGGLSGDGVLVNLVFHAIAQGSSKLALSNVYLDLVPVPGSDLIHGAVTVPVLGTHHLLIWGALLPAMRRFRR